MAPRTPGSLFLHDLPVKQVALDPANDAGIGYSPYGFVSAAGANQDSTVAKASPATVGGFCFQNNHATLERFVKLYNKATGPTSGDTPVQTYPLAPGGGGLSRTGLMMAFSVGLSFRITTGVAAADTGAASAGDVTVNMEFI